MAGSKKWCYGFLSCKVPMGSSMKRSSVLFRMLRSCLKVTLLSWH